MSGRVPIPHPLPLPPTRFPMLEARDLAARRGHARLFSGVSFRVDRGQVLVVTGANGTGKTTLLRMLAGFSLPEHGEIRWDGEAMAPFDPRLRAAIAFAGHAPALKDELTAEENLASLAALAGEIGHPRTSCAARSPRWRSSASARCPPACCRRASGGGSASPGWRSRAGACGCSTSRSPRWTPRAPRCSPTWSAGISQPAASPSPRPTRRSACRTPACSRWRWPDDGTRGPGPRRHSPRPPRARRCRASAGRSPAISSSRCAAAPTPACAGVLPHRRQPVPAAASPELDLLRRIGPGVLWVAALLASMLSLERLFAADHADGTLEQMLLSPQPLALLVLAKIDRALAVVGLAAGAAGAAAGPCSSTWAAEATGVLLAVAAAGHAVLLSLIGAIGAALTLGLRGGGVLLSLLVLPLLRAGADLRRRRGRGQPAPGSASTAHLSLLARCCCWRSSLAPLAAAAALRIALEWPAAVDPTASARNGMHNQRCLDPLRRTADLLSAGRAG